MPPQQADHLLDLIDGRLNFRAHRNLFFIVAPDRPAKSGRRHAHRYSGAGRRCTPAPTRKRRAAGIDAANAAEIAAAESHFLELE
jgi:hypothetical protein